jgi:hypothetical protein
MPQLSECDPFAYLKANYKLPQDVLMTHSQNTSTLTQHYVTLFDHIVHDMSSSTKEKDLQILCSAYMLRLMVAQSAPGRHTCNSQSANRENKKLCTVIAQLQQENTSAQHAAATLKAQCEAAEHTAAQLAAELAEARQQQARMHHTIQGMHALEMRARCAPAWFDLLLQFLATRCITGEGLKTSSAELHAAFLEFMAHAPPEQTKHLLTPSQSDLRACMERIGFDYSQTYYRGANQRCLKGVQLKSAGA